MKYNSHIVWLWAAINTFDDNARYRLGIDTLVKYQNVLYYT